jgi:molybdate-binding protein/DNA-binding XRE family transcriptional regulator
VRNHLRRLRTARGFSQGELGERAGVTRQAICAIEAKQYLPTTAVALRLAGALECRVEELFSLVSTGAVVEGDLVGAVSFDANRTRVKVANVGGRVVVHPVALLGDVLNFAVGADGLLLGPVMSSRKTAKGGNRVRVQLIRDRQAMDEEIIVAGCDPAIYLADEHLRRRHEGGTVVGWTMGSAAAVEALKRQEVHVAGLHVVDERSGESNLPYLHRHLKGHDVTVVTFASWQQGLMVKKGNPKHIRDIEDVSRRDVTLMNREEGAGARLLLDQRLARLGLSGKRVRGYHRCAASHLAVARAIAEGQADVGMGVQSAAGLLGLDFISLQDERYDLVIPTRFLSVHAGLSRLLDTIASRAFRTEVDALGGYDTRETGKVQIAGKA